MRSTSSITTRISALFLVLLLLLPLCASASEMDDNLTVGLISVKTQRLNPLLAVERDFQSLTALVYESLISLDDNYDPQPALAERYEASDDCLTWTFHLRDEIYFHDGTPLTAYDVAATVNEILRLANDETAANKGAYASLKYLVKKATANDAKTVVIKSSRPFYGFIYAMTFPILKESEVAADNPSGSGPYTVEVFQPTNYLYLTANSHWWGKTPSVKEINAIFYTTNRELTSAFEYNRVDTIITRSVTSAQYRAGVSSVNIDYRTRQLETLLINLSAYPLENENIRKAIRYAINIDALANGAYYNMLSRTNTPMPMGTWMYYDETLDEDGASVYSYNPEKAKELLAQEGWEDSDGDGVLDTVKDGAKKNLRLRLYVYEEAENSVRVETANMISDMLAKVGIKAVVTSSMSFSEVKTKLNAGSFDLCLAAFQMDSVPDPGFMLIGPNIGNYGRYKSSAMNDLFASLRKAKNKTEYQNYLYQIQDLFGKDCPFICLYYRNGAVLTRKVYTNVRDIREPEVLKGIEAINN